MARQIKTKTILARVDPELHDQLGSEADAQHTTRSELVRRLIIGFLTGITLEQRLEALQKQLASLDSKLAFRPRCSASCGPAEPSSAAKATVEDLVAAARSRPQQT